ncbi:MAG: hypothetical protein Unbinned838contig1000_8 [Prokaryotic dsDNA virus sp.]|nr:MAG: hypothetical protein Unbinned838contig1000_8 [Prokaryotic dsDNA virus sp.]|tara:strand:+ start:4676 stop:5821 length:1146 start_codon:yes stop_codon:yes gene_type:complete
MILQITHEGQLVGRYKSLTEASERTDIDKGSICKVLKGNRKTAGGFRWEYEEGTLDNSNVNINDSDFNSLLTAEGLDRTDVKSVKIWQTMQGETRYSIVTKEGGQAIREVKDEFFESLKSISPAIPKRSYDIKKESPIVYEISLPDIHYGKRTDDTPEQAEANFLNSIYELHRRAEGLNIERFLLPIGNDGMNSEGMRKATTKGTPQDDSMDWQQSFVGYTKLVIKAINYLSQYAPVDVVVIQGNHDYERMFYAGEVLSAWYTNDKNVTIDNSTEGRKYYEYGTNMIMFTHGDKEKAAEMPLIMATEQPVMFARTKFREVHCGHLHKEMVNEYRGIKVRFIPSICANDSWHKLMGYAASRCAQAYIWNKEKGCEGYLQVNI